MTEKYKICAIDNNAFVPVVAVLPNISVDIDSIDLYFTASLDQFDRRSAFFGA